MRSNAKHAKKKHRLMPVFLYCAIMYPHANIAKTITINTICSFFIFMVFSFFLFYLLPSAGKRAAPKIVTICQKAHENANGKQ